MNDKLKTFIESIDSRGLNTAIQCHYKLGADPTLDELVPKAKQILEEIEMHIDIMLTDFDNEDDEYEQLEFKF